MKIYVRRSTDKPNEIILGMSTNRSELIKLINARGPELVEHIVKWYVYPDNVSQNHWRKEICSYLDYANHRTLKGNKKLDVDTLKKYLLPGFYDCDVDDAHGVLWTFIHDVAIPNDYPEFEITSQLCKDFSITMQNIVREILPKLTTNNNLKMSDFYEMLDNCLYKSSNLKIMYI